MDPLAFPSEYRLELDGTPWSVLVSFTKASHLGAFNVKVETCYGLNRKTPHNLVAETHPSCEGDRKWRDYATHEEVVEAVARCLEIRCAPVPCDLEELLVPVLESARKVSILMAVAMLAERFSNDVDPEDVTYAWNHVVVRKVCSD